MIDPTPERIHWTSHLDTEPRGRHPFIHRISERWTPIHEPKVPFDQGPRKLTDARLIIASPAPQRTVQAQALLAKARATPMSSSPA